MEFLIQLDHKLFFLINNGLGHEKLDSVFGDLTSLGGWTICLIAIALLTHQGKRILWRHIMVLVVALLVFAPLTSFIKKSVHRSRPVKKFREQVEKGEVEVRVVGENLRRKSFPSGHSMLSFFMMTYVALHRRGTRVWVLLLAFLVAFSRIYVGVHFPIDCIVGSIMGALGAWLGWFAYNMVFSEQKKEQMA